jgi:outer membrane protein TolC
VRGLYKAVDAGQADIAARRVALEQARAAAASAYDLAGKRYHAGLANQLDVLAVQKPLLQIEQQLAGVRAQRYAAAIDLDQALGGGLQPGAPPPTDSIGSNTSPSSTSPATTP